MSDVGGGFWRGKKDDKKAKIEIQGKLLKAEHWEELIEAIRALAKKYPELRVRVTAPPK